jgi:hypothetical protein
VRRHGLRLRPDLAPKGPVFSRAEARALERRHAQRLRDKGFRVFGGH